MTARPAPKARRRAPAALLALALAGCAGGPAPAEGPPPPPPPPAAAGPTAATERRGPLVVGSLVPAEERQAVVVHWESLRGRWLEVERQMERGEIARDAALLEWKLPGTHLDVIYAVARGEVEAPATAAAEVLVVVEGARGILEVGGRPTPVSTGTVAVLPAGVRGRLLASPDDPLQLLIVRAVAPAGQSGVRPPAPDAGGPFVEDFDALWDGSMRRAEAKAVEEGVRLEDVAALPGRLSLHACAVQGFIPVRRHTAHDVVLLVLSGEGNFGASSSPHRLVAGTLAFVPKGVRYYYANAEPTGTRALLISGPSWDPADIELDPGRRPDRPDIERRQTGEVTGGSAPGAGGPPAPPR